VSPEQVLVLTGRITFASDRAGNLEIYLMNADGTDQTRLMDRPGDEPALSPDGQFIAFTGCRDDNCDVYVVNYEGRDERRLTRHRAFDGTPVWSPDGRHIAFTSGRDGKQEIYVMDADGKNKRNLTNNPNERDSYPAWSPDGRLIAFHSTPDEGIPREIYVMTASGPDRRRLTTNPALDWLPAWSPDGERIAFWSTRDGSWEMYVMNSDGAELRRLTNQPLRYSRALGGYSVSTPAWSPYGRFIAFASNPDDNYDIYVMDVDGTSKLRLTDAPGNDWAPNWSLSDAGPVDVGQVFREAVVDVVPERVSCPPAQYPAMMQQAGIEGTVVLQFVVETDGHVEPETITVVRSTREAFETPAKEMTAGCMFRPGMVRKTAVRVLIQMPLMFTLKKDSSQ
jgi:TolB protein